MSGWIPNLFGRRDARQSATGAIISLREQLAMLDKKEEYLERKVEAEHGKAKTLVAAKKTGRPQMFIIHWLDAGLDVSPSLPQLEHPLPFEGRKK